MRLLLDTNILIPLEDSLIFLEQNLANFARLAGAGGHVLMFHPASEQDILRDPNPQRRASMLQRLRRYTRLEAGPPCPWTPPDASPNDVCDNEILHALECDAAHALVTEDRGLHAKARNRGLEDRVYFIQTAERWLELLHEPQLRQLPNIENVELHTLTAGLQGDFYNSLRDAYAGFDQWFRSKAQEGRRAWLYRDAHGALSALCIYTIQDDEEINETGDYLPGRALKMCTFKVGEAVRGRKIGELFLRAAFHYATDNQCAHVFIHVKAADQPDLVDLLLAFGFEERGVYRQDQVYVKCHPIAAPPINDVSPFEYVKRFYPHYMSGIDIHKFIVPIVPEYHRILFPDYEDMPPQGQGHAQHVGNAMKLAYLSWMPSKQPRPGDIVLFYRSHDHKAITTLGIVESFSISEDPDEIEQLVSRRTVYSHDEIIAMTEKPTKVLLFRLIKHFPQRVTYQWLRQQRIARGPLQSTKSITDDAFSRILQQSRG